MAKKTRAEKHIHQHHLPGRKKNKTRLSFANLKIPILGLGIIVILTILAYLPAFRAGFAYDDVLYIQKNPLIRSIDIEKIFSENVMGNYHPITMLIFSIEFQLFGLDPTGYHIVNLLLHLVNILLVFYFILLLSDKLWVALVAALLFGIHPLHVESVVWISELKDLLYTSFFLGALIVYLKYLNDGERKYYFIALLLFVFSLLSKAMAASLPVVLLLIDYFQKRKMTTKVMLEKIPFFALSITFGIVAVFAQQLSAAVQDISTYPFSQRVVFASYGFITYLLKLVVPFNQSAFYPYPIKGGEVLPVHFYLYPILVVALAGLIIYFRRSYNKIFFGMAFFSVTIFLVLQLLPVGDAVMADRYSYIPSIGFFYLAGEAFNYLRNRQLTAAAITVLSLFVFFFCIKTFQRNVIWKNDLTLFTDVIEKYPTVAIAYNNRGSFFWEEKKYDEALLDYNKAIEYRPNYGEAYNNRGAVYLDQKKYKEAISDFNRVIELQNNYAGAYSNRGIAMLETGKNAESRADFDKAIELKPDYAEAYYNRGLLSMIEKRNEEALRDYNKALELNPNYQEAILNRDILLGVNRSPEEALADYDKAIEAKPNDPELYYTRGSFLLRQKKYSEAKRDLAIAIKLRTSYVDAYNALGSAHFDEKNMDSALYYFNKALELNPSFADAYINRGNIMRDQNNHELAMKDYDKAIELRPDLSSAYYNRGILLIKEKQFEKVIEEFSKVLELKGDSAMGYYNIGMAEIFLNRREAGCKDLKTAANMGLEVAIVSEKQFCQ
ncbi:MAG TPA: tetratricopeptide repeat protein [Chitinophagaceae bacterium]